MNNKRFNLFTIICSRPRTREELYNLRHASARNVIERCIGVLKCRFGILSQTPSYDMDIQACIPPALCAIHNFILRHDPEDINDFDTNADDFQPGNHSEGDLAIGHPNCETRERANARRDAIAQRMWDDYMVLLATRESEGA
jgi:hypothetical protein